MLASWQWLGWKGIISFIPFWMVFEVLFRSRARVVLNCPHCGFDPYLYLVDAKRAREEIEAHWRRKFAEKNIPFPEKERPLEARARAAVAPAPAHPSPVEDAAEETVGV